MNIHKAIKPLISITILLLLWFLVTYLQVFNEYILPSPQRVATTFISMLKSHELFNNIIISLRRVLIGFTISASLSLIIGYLSYKFPKAYPYYSFLLEALRNIPPLGLIPLLILWFGIGETSKIMMIILASFFPIFLSVQKGFMSSHKSLVEVGKTLNMNDNQIFKKIVLPASMPDILVGMRIGLGYSWRAIIGAEMIAAASGLGYMILFAQQMSRSDKIIIGILTIGLIGYLCDVLFSLLTKKFAKEYLVNE